MCRCEEGFWAAEGAQAEVSPVFETVEHALHNVARLVEFGVIVELHLAVFARRDAGGCLPLGQPGTQVIGVVPTVSDDGTALANIGLKTLARLRNIGSIARSQPQMNRASGPVANQMQFRIQSPFGFADPAPVAGVFFTPFAAIRCVLTWLASIISVDKSAVSRAKAAKIRSKTPACAQRFQRL